MVTSDQRASYRNPCPICGGTELCLRYVGRGTHALCKNPPEHLKREDKRCYVPSFGKDFWYVLLPEAVEARKIDTMQEVEPWYNYHLAHADLLSLLSLDNYAIDDLARRGFSTDQMEFLGYKSVPHIRDWRRIVDILILKYSQVWDQIPGFYYLEDGRPWVLYPHRSLLIPVLDTYGKISGIQCRKYEGNGPKYHWLSKNGLGGTPFHHRGSGSTLLLTEGPLKADMVYTRLNWQVMSYQGIACLKNLKQELRKLSGLERVFVANDADILKNESVYLATCSAVDTIQQLGLPVSLLAWETYLDDDNKLVPKGIDDWLNQVSPGHIYVEAIDCLESFPPTFRMELAL